MRLTCLGRPREAWKRASAAGEVGVELVALEAGEVVAHDEALGQGLVHGHGEAAAQLGQADEDEAHAALGVHAEVGGQAEVLEDVVAQVVGLVDHEHGQLPGLGGRVETIKKFKLIDQLLDPEDDELTPTQKLKRKVVHEKYADLIEAMY